MKRNYLRTLALQNFQGANARHELKPITVITGDPTSGKTSITDGAHLLLAGYLPGVGKKPGDIHADCATGSQLSIAGVFNDGSNLSRQWTKSGESAKATAIRDGAKFEGAFVPPVLLDIHEFLALSDRERVKMLFSFVDLKKVGADAEAVNARIRGIELETTNTRRRRLLKSARTLRGHTPCAATRLCRNGFRRLCR